MADCNDSAAPSSESTLNLTKPDQNTEPRDTISSKNFLRPFILEDYTYEESPEALVNLLKSMENSDISASRIHIMVGLIHLLMLESGFVPHTFREEQSDFRFNYSRVLRLSRNTAYLFKSDKQKEFVLKYVLPKNELFEVKLVIVSFCDDLIVNSMVKGVPGARRSILLDPLKYFISSNMNLSTIKFQHLKHLSKLVKDAIGFPTKIQILRETGNSVPCLETMPDEIKLMIIKKLSVRDRKNLRLTTRNFVVFFRAFHRM